MTIIHITVTTKQTAKVVKMNPVKPMLSVVKSEPAKVICLLPIDEKKRA